jgi:hypothetical protein
MLERKVLVLPKSSTVPAGFFEKKERESLIKATLKPNQKIDPAWPFKNIATEDESGQWLIQKEDAREKLATIITLPANKRFAKVLVNRYWKRLMGLLNLHLIGRIKTQVIPNFWIGLRMNLSLLDIRQNRLFACS